MPEFVPERIFDRICGDLERVICPDCGNDLLVDGRWQLMDTAHQSRFAELDVVLPCCGRTASLNEMRYDSPCGFARFVLEARNPGQVLAGRDLSSLAAELGYPERAIWARW